MQKLCRVIAIIGVIALGLGCGGRGEKVIAKVNGQKINSGDLEYSLKELARTGRPVDEAMKKRVFEQLVMKAILMDEAERIGLTKDEALLNRIQREKERVILDELVKREISMFVSVTDADIKQYYDKEYKSQKKPPAFDSVKDQIRNQLIEQKRREAFNNIVTNLRSKAKISVDDKALSAAMASIPTTGPLPR